MIVDGILLVLQGFLNIILAPLTVINIAIDITSSIPVVSQFLQVVAYVLPFSNLLPLFVIIITVYIFKISISLIRFVITSIK